MKKTGQVVVVLLVAGLMLLLAACVPKTDVTTEFGGDDVTTGGNTVPATSNAPSSSATTKPIDLYIDLAAPWKVADVEGANRAAFSDSGYYYLRNGKLSFMDTEKGIIVTLCQKAGCTHSDSHCEAHISNPHMIFYSGGHIYYDKLVRSDPYSIHIFRRNKDGTAEESVAVLGKNYISSNVSLYIGEYLATEGALYFTAYMTEAVKQDDGSVELLERDGVLLRLDLKTGMQKELLRKRDATIRLFGAREDALLFYTQDRLPAENIGDADYFERMESLPARLQVWSESAGRCVTLFEKSYKECGWILGLQGGMLYYSDGEKYYTYDLATERHTALDWIEYYVLINENYLLDQDGDTPEGEIIDCGKFLDLRTGQFVPSTYDDADMRILNLTDRGCVIEITYQGEPIPNGPYSYTIPRLRQIVAYVAFAALEDGMQESDLLVLSDEHFDS